jgi:hypothetical protein
MCGRFRKLIEIHWKLIRNEEFEALISDELVEAHEIMTAD